MSMRITALFNHRLPTRFPEDPKNAPLTGNGSLTVINGLDRDTATKLVNRANNSCQTFFYVAANSTYTLPGIPAGEYRLLFGTGLG
jgi:hypothetical protein